MTAGVATRLARVTAWLVGAQVLLFGLYWALLSTPESNAVMLAASLLLALSMLAIASGAVSGAISLWEGDGLRPALRRPVNLIGAGLVAAIVVVGTWWLTSAGLARLLADEGGIRAALIARFGWADATPLFAAAAWIARWITWVVAPLLACSAFATWRAAGPAGVVGTHWVGRALSPAALVPATLAVGLLVFLPWQAVTWRPGTLPATWVEPAVAVVKLGAILLATSAAWAVVVRVAARR